MIWKGQVGKSKEGGRDRRDRDVGEYYRLGDTDDGIGDIRLSINGEKKRALACGRG